MSKSHHLIVFLSVFLSIIVTPISSAQDFSSEVRRDILAIYDSTEKHMNQSDKTLIHKLAEMVLNHLGMKVHYLDIATETLPDDKSMERYRGVITWFQDEKMRRPEEYISWLSHQGKTGRKLVILGNMGAFQDVDSGRWVSLDFINKVFGTLGLKYSGLWTDNCHILEFTEVDSDFFNFEREYKVAPESYFKVRSLDPRNLVILKVKRKDIEDGESHLIVISRNGAYAYGPFIYYLGKQINKIMWYLNPFRFFEMAFGLKDIPRLDTTTLYGSRIFYSHIGGDGFTTISEVDRKSFSASVIRDHVIKKYPLPITASVIVGEIDPSLLGCERAVQIARSIFALENVEAGSHSYSHPFIWEGDHSKVAEKQPLHHLPIPNYKFSLDKEINSSVDYINKTLLPPGKKVKIYQWTGNCQPSSEALEMVKKRGIKNINVNFDAMNSQFPSYSYVPPLTRQVDGWVQYYSSATNENIFTNSLSGPYYGYLNVIETFKMTDEPIRLKPINVYYHFFSGSKLASLEALKQVYDWVMDQEIFPLYTSEYIEVVEGFLSGRIFRLPGGGWRLTDYGACTTVRFDAERRYPDLEKSENIVGYRYLNGSLYIFLGSKKESVIYLTNSPPNAPFIKSSTGTIEEFEVGKQKIRIKYGGYREGKVVIDNLQNNKRYKVEMNGERGSAVLDLESTANGELTIEKVHKDDILILQEAVISQ